MREWSGAQSDLAPYVRIGGCRNTVYNIWWFPIAGAASACDTLIAQAFGARDCESVLVPHTPPPLLHCYSVMTRCG